MRLIQFMPLACAAGLLLAAPAPSQTPAAMSVQVRQAEVRGTPSFLGAVVGALRYGDRVTVQTQSGAWLKVTGPGNAPTGWVHDSALTRKTVVLAAGGNASLGASSGEVALAGKGFNADVEAQFKARNKTVDFTWVDRMERFREPPAQLQAFARQGGLTPREGGAR
jgi:hypothetical protein